MRTTFSCTLTLLLCIAPCLTGCNGGGETTETSTPSSQEHDHDEHGDHDHGDETAESGHVHGEWWCNEHGVPEEECPLCDTSLIAEFKEKGDWCEDHHRPDSQCFVCHPENFEAFAARYEAKYGKQPPKPAE